MNEKQAFISSLNHSPLSVLQIANIHDLAMSASDTRGTCSGITRAGIGSVGYDCSVNGFLEIKECAEKGWIDLRQYGDELLSYMFYPRSNKAFFDQLVKEYNEKMAISSQKIDKLKHIIKLASDLSRMHYYCDANKRTSYITFLIELVKHQFLPSYISDRIIFRIKSQDEILPIVLEGMERCLNELMTLTQQTKNPEIKALADFYKTQLDLLKKGEEALKQKQPLFVDQDAGMIVPPPILPLANIKMKKTQDQSMLVQNDSNLIENGVSDVSKIHQKKNVN